MAARVRSSRIVSTNLAWVDWLELGADQLGAGSTDVGEGSNISVGGVDTNKEFSVVSLDVLHVDLARTSGLAIAASAVQLAKVHDGKAINGDGTKSVVLDSLL